MATRINEGVIMAGAVGGALGGAANLGSTLFGTGTTQNTSQNQVSKFNFRPEDVAQIQGAQRLLQPTAQNAVNIGQDLANRFAGQSFLNQFQTTPGQNVTLRTPGERSLDPTAQRLLSQEQNRINLGLNRQLQDIGRQFSSNPGVARILQNQAANSARLAQNPLSLAANQEQAQRDLLANQSMLQQSQQNEALRQAANQGLLSQLSAGSQAFNIAQGSQNSATNLLQSLSELAKLFGEQQTSTQGTVKGRSGGLFS